MIANLDGKMVVGQFGSFIWGFMQGYDGTVEEGDIFLTNDPYSVNGAISHPNDWLMLMPIYKDGRIIAWAAMFGHMTDVGGKVPGSLPTDARTIYEEGVVIPPIKIYQGGPAAARTCSRSCCTTAACRTGTAPTSTRSSRRCARPAIRCVEIAERFGDDVFYSAMDAMLERNKRAMRELIRRTVPETQAVLRGLHLRRRPGHGPVQDRLHDVARRGQVHLRLRGHRPAVDLVDQLPVERRDVQDVRGRLHDHGVRPADPVQRRLLRPHGRAHPAGHAAEAAEARRAVVPHARARPHLRPARRPARPGQPGVHVRRRLLRQPALHVLGLRQERRVVPAVPDHASAASRASPSATARTATRCGPRSPTCRTSSSRAISRCASTSTRRSPTPAARASTAAATACASATGSSSRARSRSTTTAG